MENYLLPDEKELNSFYLKKYGEEFLKLNNLKVGDRIRTAFPYEVVTQIPRSKGKEIREHKKIADGILKLDERGMLYAESDELMSFYTISFDFYNRKIFNHKQQKSKIKLGAGFIL